MKLQILQLGMYESNCSILWGEKNEAWIVDPGFDSDHIEKALHYHKLNPVVVVLTHGHFDHISAVNDLVAKYQIPVHIHPQDATWAFTAFNAMPPYPPTERPATLETTIQDQGELSYGGITARTLHTPGHTPGGCCLYFEEGALLIAGDTLFAGSVGRTDFPGGSWDQLRLSLQRLKQLPDNTRVICGHGPDTTIGEEKRSNPYLT